MKLPPFPGELKRSLVARPFTTKRGRQGCQHVYAVVLTPEQQQWFVTNFPEHENEKLMKASGLFHSTLHRYAREMHLQKSAEGHHRIMRMTLAPTSTTLTAISTTCGTLIGFRQQIR